MTGDKINLGGRYHYQFSKCASRSKLFLPLADIQTSPDPTERDSIYLGRVVEDGTPMLVPRKIFTEHAHGLGDSGSGKTSLFLCPLIEQLVMSGECSVIVIDLKADSLELLATQIAAAERIGRTSGRFDVTQSIGRGPDGTLRRAEVEPTIENGARRAARACMGGL